MEAQDNTENKLDKLSAIIDSDSNCQAVVLCGISGSGKTYFAEKLKKKGWIRISIDHLINDLYGNEFHSLSESQQRRLTEEAEKEMGRRMTELIITGKRVVADSCMCKKSKRDSIRNILSEKGIDPILIHLKASFKESMHRINNRNGLDPDHIPVTEEMLKHFFANFQEPEVDEMALTIET